MFRKKLCAVLLPLTALFAFTQEGASGEEMMAEWMKYAAPNEHHAHLKAMVGKWDMASKFRFDPNAPWVESSGWAKCDMILGGRFLEQKTGGEAMMGMPPFEGQGLLGYDNYKKKYVSSWADNMGTLIMLGEGSYDAEKKAFTIVTEYEDPITKGKNTMKSVYHIKSDNEYVLAMYSPGPDGEHFKSAVITFTRAQ